MKILVVTPFAEVDWSWFGSDFGGHVWSFRNLALFGRRPWIWLYKSLVVATKAKHFDVVISHQSHMSFYLAIAMALLGIKTRHYAYGFNHGDGRFLQGFSKILARRVFRKIDGFVVYSEQEKKTYAEYYQVNVDKYAFVHWGVNANRRLETLPTYAKKMKPYFICMGRNNRDFQLTINASIQVGVNLIVVCPEGAIATEHLPSNIVVVHNRSLEECTSLLAESVANIVPLRDDSRGAGHMTIVSAMKHGIPTIVTRVQSIDDYFFDAQHGYFVDQGSVADLSDAISRMVADIKGAHDFSTRCQQFADLWLSEDAAKSFLDEYLISIETSGHPIKEPQGWTSYKLQCN